MQSYTAKWWWRDEYNVDGAAADEVIRIKYSKNIHVGLHVLPLKEAIAPLVFNGW